MVVNLVRGQLAELYPVRGDFHLSWQASLLTSSSLVGALVGQLALGYAADRLGRRRLLLISGALTTAGCLGSACALDDGRPGHALLWGTLVACRFVMGVGIGGEYPLSASHAAEHAGAGESGARLTSTFFFMGVGPILAPALVLLCQLARAPPAFTWRFAFFAGGAMSAAAAPLSINVAVSIDVEGVIRAARDAAAVILGIYESEVGAWELEQKADSSPLTRADREANALICGACACARAQPRRRAWGAAVGATLTTRWARAGSAAGAARAARAHRERGERGGAVRRAAGLPVQLVCRPAGRHEGALCDAPCHAACGLPALTPVRKQEFIKRNGQFTVNIALLRGGVPIMGVVHTPVTVRSGSRGASARNTAAL